MSITEKKYKLMKMGISIYYLELMLILLNISQPQKLMKNVLLTETSEKKLVVNLLELIPVNKAMMQIQQNTVDEASRIQTFISKFKDRLFKKSN